MNTDKNLKESLSEEKYLFISDNDKIFMIAFDKSMTELGYDYRIVGNAGMGPRGKGYFVYAKADTKTRTVFARICMYEDKVQLRFYFKNINNHRTYIENAPEYIKTAFTFGGGDCQNCMATCKSMKLYTIDGQSYKKCCHYIAYFNNPTIDRLPDYMALLYQFYPKLQPK